MQEDKKEDKIEEHFPGYPHYPAKDDIMNPENSARANVDVENISRSNKVTSSELPDKSVDMTDQIDDPEIGDMDDDTPEQSGVKDTDEK